jgi:putative tryptophan/tyrosine transport system substrate-binding protein
MGGEQRALPLSRRHLLQGASVAGLGLLGGCGLFQKQERTAKVPRIGYLTGGTTNTTAPALQALRRGLEELGYADGRQIIIEWRHADGREEGLSELAHELVALPVDILVANGTAIPPAREATTTIPIVMVNAADPVATGHISSLPRPESNLTGLSNFNVLLSGKRLELLKEATGIVRVGVFWAPTVPADAVAWTETEGAARALNLELESLEVRTPADFDLAFKHAIDERAEALCTVGGAHVVAHRARIAEFALVHRLPTMHALSALAREGGLMGYGTNNLDLHHRAAYYVDRILKGTKPADLPVAQPREFDFVINLKTAQALGLTIPQHVLLQATEVIQ